MHRGEHGGRGEQGHCPRPKTRAPEHWPELVPSHPRASAFPKLCGLRLKVLLTDNTATSWRDGTMPAVGTALPPWAFTLSPLSDRWPAHAPRHHLLREDRPGRPAPGIGRKALQLPPRLGTDGQRVALLPTGVRGPRPHRPRASALPRAGGGGLRLARPRGQGQPPSEGKHTGTHCWERGFSGGAGAVAASSWH